MAPGCSGASFWCCLFTSDFCGSSPTGSSCGGTLEDKISAAKQANDIFIEAVLNNSGNKVGLVGYADAAPNSDYHNLSEDNVSPSALILTVTLCPMVGATTTDVFGSEN